MCNWVTLLYSGKLTKHCKPAIMENKNKNHSIKIKNIKINLKKFDLACRQGIFYIFNHNFPNDRTVKKSIFLTTKVSVNKLKQARYRVHKWFVPPCMLCGCGELSVILPYLQGNRKEGMCDPSRAHYSSFQRLLYRQE